ncbi:MAG: hemerythrin domain-containing protein [Xanthomonadales bacterium]|nr:hemerythrin domain-containing protein [Xanthomonadales bacterium]
MGFFRSWLEHNQNQTPPAPAMMPLTATPVPAKTIHYDPGLIDSLLRDHATLGADFQHIGELSTAGNYEDLRGLLINFKSRLEAHVLTENVRFYTYLQQSLGDDAANAEMMHDFRKEMNTIARAVVNFVKQYQSCAFTMADRKQFQIDYAGVGKVLEQRLDSEENQLYPLYQPY